MLVAVVIFGREIDHHIGAIEAWIDRIGPWGVVVFIGLFAALSSLLLPDTLLAMIAGALFGLGGGTIAVVAGAGAGALLQYAISRCLFRDRIGRLLSAKPSLLAIQQAVRRQELRLQVLLRLTPLNPTVITYLLGATGVGLSTFLLGCLAMIPNLFLEVYVGHAGKHLASMAGRTEQTAVMHDAMILGGLLACIVVMIVVSRLARKAVQDAVADLGGTLRESCGGEAD